MNTQLARTLVLALLAAVSAACGADRAGAGREFAVDTLESGVVAVRNPEQGAWSAEAAWTAREDLRIGTADGAAAYTLAAPTSLEVGADGRIWVLDEVTQELKVFGPDGKHVRTVGRKGQGPGEFTQPVATTWAPDGTLWVFDPANDRFSVFDTAGAFLRSHRRKSRNLTLPWGGRFDRAGRLYDVTTASGGSISLLRLDPTLERVETLPLPEYTRATYTVQRGTVKNSAAVPFTPSLVWALDRDGRLWSAVTDRYRIRVHEPGGDTVRVIERAVDPVPVTQADLDSARAGLKYFTDMGGEIDLGRVPRTKPAFTALFFDDRGYAWVRPSTPLAEQGTPFDVFEPEGRYLGRVTIPAKILDVVPIVVRGDALYTVLLSDIGVPQVVRYRLHGRAAEARLAQRE